MSLRPALPRLLALLTGLNPLVHTYDARLSAFASPEPPAPDPLSLLEGALKFIFSAIVLGAIAVIIGGNFLAARFKISLANSQEFKIQVIGVLLVQATNEGVMLGMGAFIMTLLVVGFFAGTSAYELFRDQFGVDVGHFNSLCVLSSFISMSGSVLIYVLAGIPTLFRGPKSKEHDELIERLSK